MSTEEVIERECDTLGWFYRFLTKGRDWGFIGEDGQLTLHGWEKVVGVQMQVIHPHLKELTLEPVGELEVPVMSGQKRKISELVPNWRVRQDACGWTGLFFLICPSIQRAREFSREHGRDGQVIFGLSREGRMFEIDLLMCRGDQIIRENAIREPREVGIEQLVLDVVSPRVFISDLLTKFDEFVERRRSLLDKVTEAQVALRHVIAITDSLK